MASVIRELVPKRISVFGLESFPDACCFFPGLCGAIILREMKLTFMFQEKYVSSLLNEKF